MPPKRTTSEVIPFTAKGCLSIEDAKEFLKKEISIRKLIHRGKGRKPDFCTQLSDGSLMAFVLQADAKQEASLRRSSFASSIARTTYLAVAPLTSPLVAALRWCIYDLKYETFTPDLLPIEAIEVAIGITKVPVWLEVLVRLQEIPLRRLIRCLAIANDVARVGVEDELRKRIQQFGKFEHAFYFQDVEHVLSWDIASRQSSWDNDKIPLWKRREEINNRWQFHLSESEFKAFTSGPFLKHVSPMALLPSKIAERVKVRISEQFDAREIRRQFSGYFDKAGAAIYEEPPPFPFSRGGYFDEFLFRRRPTRWHRFPAKGELKTEDQLCEALWWWRDIPSWPKELKDEFPDNWEHSAFLYEFRARILPEHTWDLFDNPWFDLDVSQRAVLFYLWPPHKLGKYFRQGRITTDTKWEHDFRNSDSKVTVDPTQSIQSAMAKYEKDFRFQRSFLLGVPEGANRTKPAPNKHWRWELIEALDGQHFLEHKLIHKDIKRLARAKKEYEAACAAAGLPPDAPARAESC